MDLTELQAEHRLWILHNFPDQDGIQPLLGAVEELGELAHHVLKYQQGIRGTEQEHLDGIADSIADCVIFLAGVCDYYGLNYGDIVREAWYQVKQRDWVADPQAGGQ